MDNTNSIQQQKPVRKVSFLLGLGIFLLPIIFAWFTLRQGYRTQARVVSFFWLIFTLIVAFAPSSNTTSSSNTSVEQVASVSDNSQDTPVEEEKVNVIKITARQLFNSYDANEVAADRQFKDQTLLVSGTVQSIESGLSDGADVHFNVGDEYGINSVSASGDENFDNNAANLSKGQQVTLRCRGAGEIAGLPFLDQCSFN